MTKWKVVVSDPLCKKQTLHKCETKEENAAEENKSRLVYVCDSVLKDSEEFDQKIQVSGVKEAGRREMVFCTRLLTLLTPFLCPRHRLSF